MENISQNNRLKKLTIEDKIVLLLLELNYLKDRFIFPEILTEYGMQQVVRCSVGLISQILTKLENKNYISRRLARIKNKNRKQYVFFLTELGLKYGLELKKNVGEFDFKIVLNNYTQRKLFEYKNYK